MASIEISVRTKVTDPNAEVKVRMRVSAYYREARIYAYAPIGITIPKKVWNEKLSSIKPLYLKGEDNEPYRRAKENLDKITDLVNAKLNTITESDGRSLSIEISSKWLKSIIKEYWDEIDSLSKEAKLKRKEAKKKETLTSFIKRYIKEIESGERLTDSGVQYSNGSVRSIKTSLLQFEKFQQTLPKRANFDDIDFNLYQKYISWLTKVKNYSRNTIGGRIKELKSVMNKSKDEGLHSNTNHQNKSFKKFTEDVDNIYLTQAELEALEALDLSDMPDGYDTARDLFLLGCCLAQRVSDYSTIKESDISTSIVRIKSINGDIEEREVSQVTIVQQKGGVKVIIPLNAMAKRILDKHQNKLPTIVQQKINQYIKEIGRRAGITEIVEINSVKGGKKRCEEYEKCDLIVSHTARRTGATLMYLSGMDLYDICKITGHTSIKMLRKYIKADELDVMSKIIGYDYFN